MRALFRWPVFPVVFKVGGTGAVVANTLAELESYLKRHAAEMPDSCDLIDFRWQPWTLYPKKEIVSPMAMKLRYTKREFLLFCGASEQQVSNTNLNRYSREKVFDFVVQAAQRKP